MGSRRRGQVCAELPRFLLPQLALTSLAVPSSEPGGEDRGRQAPEPQQQAPAVVLDGANLLWAYGHALARRFGCKVYPASAGLLVALNYVVRGDCFFVARTTAAHPLVCPARRLLLLCRP